MREQTTKRIYIVWNCENYVHVVCKWCRILSIGPKHIANDSLFSALISTEIYKKKVVIKIRSECWLTFFWLHAFGMHGLPALFSMRAIYISHCLRCAQRTFMKSTENQRNNVTAKRERFRDLFRFLFSPAWISRSSLFVWPVLKSEFILFGGCYFFFSILCSFLSFTMVYFTANGIKRTGRFGAEKVVHIIMIRIKVWIKFTNEMITSASPFHIGP